MPCHYEETPGEIEARKEADFAARTAPMRAALDTLTHENDILREALLKIISLEPKAAIWIGTSLSEQIALDQVEHRKEDLRRLTETFNDKILEAATDKKVDPAQRALNAISWGAFLLKVREADPEKPLEPQLGFDPDDY